MTIHTPQPSLRLVGVPWTESLLDALAAVAAPAQQASPQWRLERRGEEVRLHTTRSRSALTDRDLVAAVPDLVGRLLRATWATHSDERAGLVVDLTALGELTSLYHAAVGYPWRLTTREDCDWEWQILDGQREVVAGPYTPDDDALVGYLTDPDGSDPRAMPGMQLLVAARAAIPTLATALAQTVTRHQPDTTRITETIALLREDGDTDRAEALADDIGYWDIADIDDIQATTCTVCHTAWPCPTLTHIHRHITAE